VVRDAARLVSDIPVRVAEAHEIRRSDRGLALAHAGIVLGSFRPSRAIPEIAFEALATGAPLITAGTDAARELLVDGESALLVAPADPRALAAAIERLASDPGLRNRIAERGKKVFQEQASREVLGRRWRALVEERLREQVNAEPE